MAPGMGAGAWLISGLTGEAGNAGESVPGGWLALLVVSLLIGAAPYFLAAKPKTARKEYAARMPLGEQETGAWSRTTTSKVLLWLPPGLLAFRGLIFIPAFRDGDASTTAGKQFAVTIGDPDTPAALLPALRDRKQGGRPTRANIPGNLAKECS